MSVKIIVDSACDITQEKAKEMNIDVLPLKTMFGDEEFLDGVTLNQIGRASCRERVCQYV